MQEQDPLSGRKTQSLIHCVGDATVGLRYPCVDPPGPATQDVDRTIGRASIDDDMLDGHGTLHCNAFQAGFQVFYPVESRGNDRPLGPWAGPAVPRQASGGASLPARKTIGG